MARTVRLDSLEAQVRQRSDTESLTSRFTQAEVWEYINQSWAELYNYILQTCQDYYLNSYSFNTTSGVTDYALPADFFLDRGADTTVAGQLFQLDRWQWDERSQYENTAIWSPGFQWAYNIVGSNISLRPSPGGVYSVRLWYYPAPSRMTVASSPIDCMSGFEEYIVNDAAAKILIKDDRDASGPLALKAAAKRVIDMMIANRSRSNPNRVIKRWRLAPRIIRAV